MNLAFCNHCLVEQRPDWKLGQNCWHCNSECSGVAVCPACLEPMLQAVAEYEDIFSAVIDQYKKPSHPAQSCLKCATKKVTDSEWVQARVTYRHSNKPIQDWKDGLDTKSSGEILKLAEIFAEQLQTMMKQREQNLKMDRYFVTPFYRYYISREVLAGIPMEPKQLSEEMQNSCLLAVDQLETLRTQVYQTFDPKTQWLFSVVLLKHFDFAGDYEISMLQKGLEKKDLQFAETVALVCHWRFSKFFPIEFKNFIQSSKYLVTTSILQTTSRFIRLPAYSGWMNLFLFRWLSANPGEQIELIGDLDGSKSSVQTSLTIDQVTMKLLKILEDNLTLLRNSPKESPVLTLWDVSFTIACTIKNVPHIKYLIESNQEKQGAKRLNACLFALKMMPECYKSILPYIKETFKNRSKDDQESFLKLSTSQLTDQVAKNLLFDLSESSNGPDLSDRLLNVSLDSLSNEEKTLFRERVNTLFQNVSTEYKMDMLQTVVDKNRDALAIVSLLPEGFSAIEVGLVSSEDSLLNRILDRNQLLQHVVLVNSLNNGRMELFERFLTLSIDHQVKTLEMVAVAVQRDFPLQLASLDSGKDLMGLIVNSALKVADTLAKPSIFIQNARQHLLKHFHTKIGDQGFTGFARGFLTSGRDRMGLVYLLFEDFIRTMAADLAVQPSIWNDEVVSFKQIAGIEQEKVFRWIELILKSTNTSKRLDVGRGLVSTIQEHLSLDISGAPAAFAQILAVVDQVISKDSDSVVQWEWFLGQFQGLESKLGELGQLSTQAWSDTKLKLNTFLERAQKQRDKDLKRIEAEQKLKEEDQNREKLRQDANDAQLKMVQENLNQQATEADRTQQKMKLLSDFQTANAALAGDMNIPPMEKAQKMADLVVSFQEAMSKLEG